MLRTVQRQRVAPARSGGCARQRAATALVAFAGLAVASLAPVAVWPRAALARDDAKVGAITALNRRAIEAYENLDFDEAEKLLRQALVLGESAGLTRQTVHARTCVTLGIVLYGGFKKRDAAKQLFRTALQIAPDIKLSRALANPQIQQIFDEAIQELTSSEGRPSGGAESKDDVQLVHDAARSGLNGQPLSLEAWVTGGSGHELVVVNYRAAGAPEYAELKMERRPGGRFEGAIPASAMAGRQLEYFVELRRADGTRLSSRGSSHDPMLVALEGETAAASATSMAGPSVIDQRSSTTGDERRFVFALLAGTGAGWANGNGEVHGDHVTSAGVAWSELGHLAPQIGYFVTPRLMLAVQGRVQLVSGASSYAGGVEACPPTGTCAAAKAAFAGFAKAAWFTSAPTQRVRPYVAFSLGGGTIRYVSKVNGDPQLCGNAPCKDTVGAGPLLGGPGAGVSYRVADAVRLVLGVELLAAAPNFTFDLDVNAGVSFQL
jgi:hypothetical protein